MINKLQEALNLVQQKHTNDQYIKLQNNKRVTSEKLNNLVNNNPLLTERDNLNVDDLSLQDRAKEFTKNIGKLSVIFNQGLQTYYTDYKRELKNLHKCEGLIDQDDCA